MQNNASSAREIDQNGYVTIEANPISRSGVFQYSGRQLPGADPNRIYNVYRPEEELNNPETLASFQLLPIINEHRMLGEGYENEILEKERHGTTGERVFYQDGVLYAPIRIFSNALRALLEAGKKALSCGYKCAYEKSSGAFNGVPYDYIQRQIRGNHLALVGEARCDVAVLDHFAFDHFDLALDNEGAKMADEKKDEKKTDAKDADAAPEKKEMDLKDVHKYLKEHAPMWKELQEMMAGDEPVDGEGAKETVLDADTKEKPGDQKAEDKDDEKEKKEGMDAAEVSALKTRLDALEKDGVKAMVSQITQRDKLAKEVSAIVGTFDHADMTAEEVAEYAMKKLEIKAPKGQEQTAVTNYLAGRAAGKSSSVAYAMDSAKTLKTGGLLAKRLNGAAA